MTLVEAHREGERIYEGCGTHAVIPDEVFMLLTRASQTWPGRFNRNFTQLVRRSELRELLDTTAPFIAAEVAKALKA